MKSWRGAVLAAVFLGSGMTLAFGHGEVRPSPSPAPMPDPSIMPPPSVRPPVAPPAKLAIPQWKPGMSWRIECDFPDPQTAAIPPWISGHKRRTAPQPQYLFTVERAADVGALRLFSVIVKPQSPDQKTGAELVFGGERAADGTVKSLFLMKALYKVPVAGGSANVRRDYNKQAKEPFPVLNDDNQIPTDFPMLSAELAKHDGTKDGVWKDYQAAEVVEGDRRSRAVRQTYMFASDKMQFGERYRVKAERKECVDVFLKMLAAPGHGMRLVFHPAHPWPIYGEGQKGRFWLLP
jgi:hypothetical protein